MDGWTSNNPVDWGTGHLRIWQIGQPEIHRPIKLDEWITNRFKIKTMWIRSQKNSALTVLKRYIKVASMFPIDNLVRELLEKGQHIGQQSGHQSGQLLNSPEVGLFYINWLDNQKSGRAGEWQYVCLVGHPENK